jgi:alkylated DNA nucleotide flippase Atl1
MGFNLCWHCRTPFKPTPGARFCDPECQTAWWDFPVRDLTGGEHVLLGIGTAAIAATEIMSDRWGTLTLTGERGQRVGIETGMTGLRGILRARVLDAAPGAIPDRRPTTSAWPPAAPGDVIELGYGAVFTESATGAEADIAVGVRPAWTDPRLGWLREAQALRVCGARIALELHAADAPGLRAVIPENHAGAPGPADRTAAVEPWRSDYRVRVGALLESLAAEYLHRPFEHDGETFVIDDDTATVTITAPSPDEYRDLIEGGDRDDLAGAAHAAFTTGPGGQSVTLRAVCGHTRFHIERGPGAATPDVRYEDWTSPRRRFPDYLEELTAARPRPPLRDEPRRAGSLTDTWQAIVRAALAAIPEGRWTAIKDLKDLTGHHQRGITALLGTRSIPGDHRVLYVEGRTRRKASSGLDPDAVQRRLRREGVRFSPAGVADPTQRMSVDDLREAINRNRAKP